MVLLFTSCNAGVLKEPIGFIKPIQWILSIFAFATMTSPVLEFSFKATCSNVTEYPFTSMFPTTAKEFSYSVGYPFRLDDKPLSAGYICNDHVNQNLIEAGHASSGFYVFVGVMAFLYCMAALAFYILCGEQYRNRNICSVADFIISGVIVILWLASSSAWAQGLQDLKFYTDLEKCGFFKLLTDCKHPNSCVQDTFPNFASLNVSVIFGFLNMCVWIGNMWFVYKETPWRKNEGLPPKSSGGFGGGPSNVGDKGRI